MKNTVKIPRFANAKVSVHSLTIDETEKRKAMLRTMREVLKRKLPASEYLDVYFEISEMYLF